MMNKNVSLIESMEKDLDRWSLLPPSLVGRINLIKMKVSPKFLYLFQHIPILLTKTFFDKLDKKKYIYIYCNSKGSKNLLDFVNLCCSLLNLRVVWPSPTLDSTTGQLMYRNFCTGSGIVLLHLPGYKLKKASSRYSLSSLLCS